MVFTANIRLSDTSTLVISYDDSTMKATVTEANSGKTGTATLTDGGAKSSRSKKPLHTL